ncbi:GPI-anchor transamidase subunit GAB1 [Kluyveromyces lactis]|uniref:KLLA0E04907p n=1 Tax=Kluyveromyces lactis (strain ATCC 8585 / CBS 2359 / DSM 70799 / NBRC 1267 / NRRL Y-1140 / WM37) TaxID=284590 RepID=Q6CPH2_KLULA|nr:uncharacterized protein KLLA0_E04907g [Kluyveromyces lactis]CAG99254.1 KLLA0E04907p [Kluyveromyces lactis]|eukprot:XP_454167.1 uncharacterized protein KLLA0_E04907g [Kluyveromyces lactis]
MVSSEWQVVWACFASRLAVSYLFPSLQQQLDRTVEFSTPVTSYRSLQEGAYLLLHNLPIYDGGVVHHVPLLVALMAFVQQAEFLMPVLFAAMDTLIAYQLMQIAKIYQRQLQIPSYIPGVVYAVNPLVLLSCVSQSTCLFVNLSISTSLLFALSRQFSLSAICIALAGYLSPYAYLLLIPLAGICGSNSFGLVVKCTLVSIVLQLISFKLNNDNWNYLTSTYWILITFSKIRPNLGLWWYFFIEMFEFFIPFFKSVFNIFVVSFIPPFTIRFNQQSFYAFVLCLGWITLTKSYPTLGDGGFFLSFIPFFKPIFGYLRYPVISTLLFIHAIILSPIFYYLWIGLGSGNSNFFYAISLVYALAISSVIVDLTWAMLRIEYDSGKPNLSLKLTQI